MARYAFLRNLRAAAGFLSPDVQTDFRGDQAKFARVLKSAAMWLTPRAVEDYDETEFSELPMDQRQRLTKGVAEFESVAREVPENKPASPDSGAAPCRPSWQLLKFSRYISIKMR